MITVTFSNVGRDKKSWAASLKANPNDVNSVAAAVSREAKRNGGLMSRYIDAVVDEDGAGMLFAGFHSVGRFAVSMPKAEAAHP